MAFYHLSEVTAEELESAAVEVEKQLKDKKACATFLIENAYWTELLKELYPNEYEAIAEKTVEIDGAIHGRCTRIPKK